MTTSDAFWAKVDKSGDCWLRSGGHDEKGYSTFTPPGGTTVRAHRFAYEDVVGPIPDGLVIDHLCRNPPCVNPAHMEAVTSRENTLRGTGLTARWAQRTHCKHGHELTPDNVSTFGSRGGRRCLTCNRERNRVHRDDPGVREARRAYDRARYQHAKGVVS